MRKSVYSRVDEDLYEKVREFSKTSSQTLSAALENLVLKGLSETDTKERVEHLEKEALELRKETQKLQQEKGELLGKLLVCQKNEKLAVTARDQAELIKTQFEQILSIGVATCGGQGCTQIWRLYDIWRHQCPACGNSSAKLLTHYAPTPTVRENARDVLAIVGGVTALVGLLNVISGSNDKA